MRKYAGYVKYNSGRLTRDNTIAGCVRIPSVESAQTKESTKTEHAIYAS